MGSTPIPNPTLPSYPKVLMLGNSTTCKKLDIISDSSSAMSPIQGANRFGKLYLLNLFWIHPFLHWLPPSPLTWKMSLALLVSFLPSSNLLCNEIKKKKIRLIQTGIWSCFSPGGKKKLSIATHHYEQSPKLFVVPERPCIILTPLYFYIFLLYSHLLGSSLACLLSLLFASSSFLTLGLGKDWPSACDALIPPLCLANSYVLYES